MNKQLIRGGTAILLGGNIATGDLNHLDYDYSAFDSVPLVYMSSAGGSAAAIMPNPLIDSDFEIRMPFRHGANAVEHRDE
jgi:hypothetical protein